MLEPSEHSPSPWEVFLPSRCFARCVNAIVRFASR
jgi:hypothetical protein